MSDNSTVDIMNLFSYLLSAMEVSAADWLSVPGLSFYWTFAAVVIFFVWTWQRRRSTYLLDFQVYKPPDR